MTAVALALILMLCGGRQGGPKGDLVRAEQAYRAGHYADAFALFSSLLTASRLRASAPDVTTLYNLGNCAYRLERHAVAAWFYRRALLGNPGHARAAFNLSLAERQLGIVREPDDSPVSAVLAWLDTIPRTDLLIAVSALQLVGLLGLIATRRRRWRQLMAVLIAFGVLGATRLVQHRWLGTDPDGVVVARRIELRTEPHRDMPAMLELRAGALVEVAERSDRWLRLRHPRGGGWTQRAGIGIVE